MLCITDNTIKNMYPLGNRFLKQKACVEKTTCYYRNHRTMEPSEKFVSLPRPQTFTVDNELQTVVT